MIEELAQRPEVTQAFLAEALDRFWDCEARGALACMHSAPESCEQRLTPHGDFEHFGHGGGRLCVGVSGRECVLMRLLWLRVKE